MGACLYPCLQNGAPQRSLRGHRALGATHYLLPNSSPGEGLFPFFSQGSLGTVPPPHQTGPMQIQTHPLTSLLCDLGQITDSLSHGSPVCNTTLHIAGLLGGLQGKAFAKSSYPNAWRKDVSFLAGRRVSDSCCPPSLSWDMKDSWDFGGGDVKHPHP